MEVIGGSQESLLPLSVTALCLSHALSQCYAVARGQGHVDGQLEVRITVFTESSLKLSAQLLACRALSTTLCRWAAASGATSPSAPDSTLSICCSACRSTTGVGAVRASKVEHDGLQIRRKTSKQFLSRAQQFSKHEGAQQHGGASTKALSSMVMRLVAAGLILRMLYSKPELVNCES